MVQTILGFGLFLLPAILIVLSKRNRFSFESTIVSILGVQTAIALLLQTFQIFTLPAVLAVHIVLVIIAGMLLRPFISFKEAWSHATQHKTEAYAACTVLLLALIFLTAAHFYPKTYVSHLTDPTIRFEEHAEIYSYPLYADEWYAVAFAKHSIATQSLPSGNPLTKNPTPFPNLETAFHSLLAEFFVLFSVDPLKSYVFFSIGFNTLLIFLTYRAMRSISIPPFSAALAAASGLFIVSGANLPGLWTLLPLTLGLVGFLPTLTFLFRREYKQALFASLLSLLFYPPLIIFLAPTFLAVGVYQRNWRTLLAFSGITFMGACIVLLFLAASHNFSAFNFKTVSGYIGDTLLYRNFTEGNIPVFNPIYIIPWALIAGCAISIPSLLQRKHTPLTLSVTIGILFWIVYSLTPTRFSIGYQRLVITTSLLIAVSAGLGFQKVFIGIEKLYPIIRSVPKSLRYLTIVIVFVLFLPGYTTRTNWQTLVLPNERDGSTITPAAPRNRYLTNSDLEIFSGITSKNILSIPWKGTVIGIATNNFPITSKAGTITQNQNLYNEFIEGSCHIKKNITRKYDIHFVYTPPFNCRGIRPIGKPSSEGLQLYKVTFVPH